MTNVTKQGDNIANTYDGRHSFSVTTSYQPITSDLAHSNRPVRDIHLITILDRRGCSVAVHTHGAGTRAISRLDSELVALRVEYDMSSDNLLLVGQLLEGFGLADIEGQSAEAVRFGGAAVGVAVLDLDLDGVGHGAFG